MLNTDMYNYINVLGKAADASWLRNEAISNNIANVDTPNYKRVDVDFASTLRSELSKLNYRSLDSKMRDVDLDHLDVREYTDAANYSYRIDGNNVDIDQENVYMAENTLVYQGLTDSITQEFSRLKTVCK